MESIYRKHMAIKLGIYLLSAQLMGGGDLLWLSYIGGTPKHSPFRCNKHTALPERRLVSFGVDSPQYEKIVHWKCVGKGHWWIRREMKQALVE